MKRDENGVWVVTSKNDLMGWVIITIGESSIRNEVMVTVENKTSKEVREARANIINVPIHSLEKRR